MRVRRLKINGKPMETHRELWEQNWAEFVCKVRGHTDPERKFRGELLCRRCRHVIGHW